MKEFAPWLGDGDWWEWMERILFASGIIGNVFYYTAGVIGLLQILNLDSMSIDVLFHPYLWLPAEGISSNLILSIIRGFLYLLWIGLLLASASVGHIKQISRIENDPLGQALAYVFIITSNTLGSISLAEHTLMLLKTMQKLFSHWIHQFRFRTFSGEEDREPLLSNEEDPQVKELTNKKKEFYGSEESTCINSTTSIENLNDHISDKNELAHHIRDISEKIRIVFTLPKSDSDAILSNILKDIEQIPDQPYSQEQLTNEVINSIAKIWIGCSQEMKDNEKVHSISIKYTQKRPYSKKDIAYLIFNALMFATALLGLALLAAPDPDNPLFPFKGSYIIEWPFFIFCLLVPVFKGVFISIGIVQEKLKTEGKQPIDAPWMIFLLKTLNLLFIIACSFSFASTGSAAMEGVKALGGSNNAAVGTMIPVAFATAYATAIAGFYGSVDTLIKHFGYLPFHFMSDNTQERFHVRKFIQTKQQETLDKSLHDSFMRLADYIERLSDNQLKLFTVLNSNTLPKELE